MLYYTEGIGHNVVSVRGGFRCTSGVGVGDPRKTDKSEIVAAWTILNNTDEGTRVPIKRASLIQREQNTNVGGYNRKKPA